MPLLQKTYECVEIDAASDGFPVGLFAVADDSVLVTAGSWHEHFDNMGDALNCAAFLLSNSCRLKTVFRGDAVVSCTVQSLINDEWSDGPKVGFFLVPFWKPKRIEFHQNQIIGDF